MKWWWWGAAWVAHSLSRKLVAACVLHHATGERSPQGQLLRWKHSERAGGPLSPVLLRGDPRAHLTRQQQPTEWCVSSSGMAPSRPGQPRRPPERADGRGRLRRTRR